MDRQTDGRMAGWMHRLMDGQTNRMMDGWIHTKIDKLGEWIDG